MDREAFTQHVRGLIIARLREENPENTYERYGSYGLTVGGHMGYMKSSTDNMLEAVRICYFHPDLIIPRMLSADKSRVNWITQLVYEEFLRM